MRSPPGTSPMPVWPALSFRMTTLRVNSGPCAPLRLSSMLSSPATGTTSISMTTGALSAVRPADSALLDKPGLPPAIRRALFRTDLPGFDHCLPARDFVGNEFFKLISVAGDHIEANRLELCLD